MKLNEGKKGLGRGINLIKRVSIMLVMLERGEEFAEIRICAQLGKLRVSG